MKSSCNGSMRLDVLGRIYNNNMAFFHIISLTSFGDGEIQMSLFHRLESILSNSILNSYNSTS